MNTNYKKMYSDPEDRLIAEILDLMIATQFDQDKNNPDVKRLIALEDKFQRMKTRGRKTNVLHQTKENDQ